MKHRFFSLTTFLLIILLMLLGCRCEGEDQIRLDKDLALTYTGDFWIDEQTFQSDDIKIVYPIIRTREKSDFIDNINSEIKSILFLEENEESLADYTGVIFMNNFYEVTYLDKDVLSICLYIDAAIGLGSGRIDRVGLTIDLSKMKKMQLCDLGIELDYMCKKIQDGDYVLSNDFIAEPSAEEITSLIESLDIYSTNNFYLSPEAVQLIVENRMLSRTNVGVIKINYGQGNG